LSSPSLQLAAAHTPPAQTWLEQSVATRQAAPPTQAPHVPPPQSTSVSWPSLTWLRQESGAQRAAEQMRVPQSVSAPQLAPIAHG